MPRSFRGEEPNGYPDPRSMVQYKPPSVFAQHRALAIVFGIIFLALAAYCIKSMLTPPVTPPPEPIYIQPLEPAVPPPPH
jgi:hypothetical protein